MSAASEFLKWRELVGLPLPKENDKMTEFAQMKACHRARHQLKDGHDGPECPEGWGEGTAEAAPMWGWLTCRQEEQIDEFGAGICIGADDERYMVLITKGSGQALIPRHNIPIFDTSDLTPLPCVYTRPPLWQGDSTKRLPTRA